MVTENKQPEKKETRGRPPRYWVKIDCRGILSGSINYQYTLEEQMVWVKLIAYSAVCGGPPGWISDNGRQPIPHWFIANELHCSIEVLDSCIKKGTGEGRIKENGSGLQITNFDKHQFTEYDRQKPYRQKKKPELSQEESAEINRRNTENIEARERARGRRKAR